MNTFCIHFLWSQFCQFLFSVYFPLQLFSPHTCWWKRQWFDLKIETSECLKAFNLMQWLSFSCFILLPSFVGLIRVRIFLFIKTSLQLAMLRQYKRNFLFSLNSRLALADVFSTFHSRSALVSIKPALTHFPNILRTSRDILKVQPGCNISVDSICFGPSGLFFLISSVPQNSQEACHFFLLKLVSN